LALLPLFAWLAWRGDLVNAVRTRNIKGHLLRGIISSCGMFSGFVALTYLPLSDAVAIGYASPLIVVMLAALILKQRVRAYRWSAVAVGFLGVLIMLMPHLGGRHAEASLVAPFEYTTMIWAFLLGWFVFGQAPHQVVVAGAGMVAAAGLFVLWREHQLGLARAKDVEAASQRPA
jgi:drug/metabolite transporter (DMT)-like permease